MKWIAADPEHLGGKPRIEGTRISIAFLLESFAAWPSLARSSVTTSGTRCWRRPRSCMSRCDDTVLLRSAGTMLNREV